LKLTLAQLEALFWIARLGSVRAAAARLSLTQPALSLRVKELEAAVGGRLLNRDSYRATLTSLGALFAGVSAQHGKLVNDGKSTYKGTDAVVIRDTSDNSKLYVAETGKPYPVALVGGKKGQTGTIAFDDWNKATSLSAPKNAIDISQFGG